MKKLFFIPYSKFINVLMLYPSTGAQEVYLKRSIRTKNELPNRFYKFVHLHLFIAKYKFVHLQLFNVKYKFVHLQLFDVKFLFSEKHIFRSRRERLFMDDRPQFQILNSPGKMMTCYLRDTNKFQSYRTLCTSILNADFRQKVFN